MSHPDEHRHHDRDRRDHTRDRRDAAGVHGEDGGEPANPGVVAAAVALVGLTAVALWLGFSPAPRPAPAPASQAAADAIAPAGAVMSAADAVMSPAGGPGAAAGVARAGAADRPTLQADTAPRTDPLPSWNDGAVKQAILAFVKAVTTPGTETFVPVAERVAVFDHDGTLVCEKPVVHGMFLIDRVRDLVARQPDLAHEEPFASLTKGDIEAVRRLGKKYFLDLTFTTLAGVPEDRLEQETRRFLTEARHPVFDVPYGEVTYEPMKEVVALLRRHDFSVWICSGSGVHFMRPAAEAWYGIGPEHVIASRAATELRELGDAPAGDAAAGGENRRLALVVTPHLQVLNDEERKPVSIGEHVGRRPIFAAGNVGTTGDIEMLRWSQSGHRPSLQLLVLHDDADREMAYDEPAHDSLEAAARYGWNVVRMKSDWKRIFARPLAKKAAPTSAGPAPNPGRWEQEVAAIEQAVRDRPPAPGGVLFLGSSNIRMWNTLADDFAGLNPLNRGVGGAQLAELVALAPRLVGAAEPAVVVVSAGSNDIAAGATPEQVHDAFVKLVAVLHDHVPDAPIVYQAIAPSIKRWEQWEKHKAANDLVRRFIAAQGEGSGLAFVDVSAAFLDANGRPAWECLLDDLLHPSDLGNARRAAILRPAIEQARGAGPRPPAAPAADAPLPESR
jgi:lysophospholipase L1-like esterase/phosphoserine phosphatase